MADNPSSRFKFVSPGVFVDEIDNSELPAEPAGVGPLVIGRARKGPAMQPVTINSYSDFVDTFGAPVVGAEDGDVWREGNILGPTYGALAAQAWLRNNAPVSYLRMVGEPNSGASTAGAAGWKAGTLNSTPADGGAWGLFVWPSGVIGATGSADASSSACVTGALAAVFYAAAGRVMISGNTLASQQAVGMTAGARLSASACNLYESDSNGNVTLVFAQSDGTAPGAYDKTSISLDPNSRNYLRKVLNTNPTLTNTAISKTSTASGTFGLGKLWLGESYARSLVASSSDGAGMGILSDDIVNSKFHCAVLPMRNSGSNSQVQNDFTFGAQKSTTGWFIAQDLGSAASFQPQLKQKLFRIESLTAGEWVQRDVKISIANIKQPQGEFQKYGTFSLFVRQIIDTDNVPLIIERFDNLDLNPASENYIAKKIGDKYEVYSEDLKGNRVYGQYLNKSKYIRVVMDEDVDGGVTNPKFLPFGVFGPLKYRNCTLISGSGPLPFYGQRIATGQAGGPWVGGDAKVYTILDGGDTDTFGRLGGYIGGADAGVLQAIEGKQTAGLSGAFTASVVMPSLPVRRTSTWGQPKSLKQTYWGAWTGRSATDAAFNEDIPDTLRARLKGLQSDPANTTQDIANPYPSINSAPASRSYSDLLYATTKATEIAWLFTLDDISGSAAEGYQWVSGSRQGATSISAVSASYTGTLDAGLDRFTTCLHGGFEGFDITEIDPFRDSISTFTSATDPKESYELNTLRRAINIVSDPEVLQYNIATIPGIMQHNATKYLLDTVEDRGDALAIIDIRKIYDPASENTSSAADRNAYSIEQAVVNLRDRNINNSYGACYAPWVRVQEPTSNRTLWVPPSVVAIGALSTTDRESYPWYAPAGFARGGLTDGDGGLPVLDVSKRLTQDDRDRLYEVGINPIAKFPAEGIVIFGQKTLQQTRSALDRINVRRLMIYLKRNISFIASRLLFEQNTQDTWNRFKAQALPLLEDVKAQFGVEDFKLILDESTTTPDLIDRNIIYAKLLVKPTRSVEFFAIDFVVTNSGAGFED